LIAESLYLFTLELTSPLQGRDFFYLIKNAEVVSLPFRRSQGPADVLEISVRVENSEAGGATF